MPKTENLSFYLTVGHHRYNESWRMGEHPVIVGCGHYLLLGAKF